MSQAKHPPGCRCAVCCAETVMRAGVTFAETTNSGVRVTDVHVGEPGAAPRPGDDDQATLVLVRSLRNDPSAQEVMRVFAALADASVGLPIHYTWNKLWWLLWSYAPKSSNPPPHPKRRRKR